MMSDFRDIKEKRNKVCYLEVKLKEGDVKEMLRLSAVLLLYHVNPDPNPKPNTQATPTSAYPKSLIQP